MMSCPPQLNADTDSPNRRDTICLRDNVGSGFDAMAPESMSGGSRTYMTHTGGGIAGIEMRSCTSLRKAKSKPKNGQSYAFQCYCISTKTALAAVLLRRLDDLPRTSLLFHSFLVTMRGDGVSTFQQVHLIITIHEVKLAVVHLVLALRVRGQRRGRDDRQVDVGQREILVAERVRPK